MLLFSQIHGQQRQLEALRRAIDSGKLANAYLFSGPAGVGKATTALAFAAALNCEQAPGRGCGACGPCEKLAGGHHPDLLTLVAEKQFIVVDQVRALEQRLAFPPHEARYRLVLIDGADRLNPSAANALLKAVEEPRPGTLFVLVSAVVHRVMPTLISRCQRLHFAPLPREAVESALERALPDHDPERRAVAASVCEGSPGRAFGLLEGDGLAAAQATLDQLMSAASGSRAADIFAAAQEAGRDKAHIAQVLDLLRIRLRDLLLAQAGLEGRLAGSSQADKVAERARALGLPRIRSQLRAVQEAEEALFGNVNASLLLENLALRLREEGLR
ncbi:MAG: DNA polymerase III subunit delta' [Proteobacteria bacterium]|nr:MAG: DNA polymerase III subunit delta' [Pseudomonadota bacterium]PIE19076.1 MAG: DNA polymerase III subunit delta' [Pseudomonadota bacterium]